MIFPAHLIRWQKLSGIVAMFMLIGALLAFADAMVGGLKGNSGTIELIPDSHFLISGPMPAKTEAISEFVIEKTPSDNTVGLIAEEIFSGYWFGGSMWRGAIVVDKAAQEGSYELVVKDRFGEKQNPALVFSVRIWPDLMTKNAHSPSFLTRKSGLSPYAFAAAFLLGGILAGAANFILSTLWTRHLSSCYCGEIFVFTRQDQEEEATCELLLHQPIDTGTLCKVYSPSGEYLCEASVLQNENNMVRVLTQKLGVVRIGDIVCFHGFIQTGS